MPFVDENRPDVARAGVQVLVGAPRGKVDIPVVQRQLDIARRVGQVESGDSACGVRSFGQPRHVEQLPCEIVDAAKEHQREFIGVFVYHSEDVFFTNQVFAIPRRHFDNCLVGIKAVEPCLRLEKVAVGREHLRFADDLVARLRGTIERDEHQVNIGGQRVHADHLRLLRANDSSHGRCQEFVIAVPGVCRLKVAFDAVFRPLVEFQLYGRAHAFRLQPQ